jgi:hypothetical protein
MLIERHSLLLLVIAAACTGQHGQAGRNDATQQCGPLLWWKMPESDVVYSSPSDSRTYDVLFTQARIDAVILASEAACRQAAGVYPTGLLELDSLPDRLAACRVDQAEITDAWERPLRYSISADGADIRSAGPDGLFNTPDDIARPTGTDQHSVVFDPSVECASH